MNFDYEFYYDFDYDFHETSKFLSVRYKGINNNNNKSEQLFHNIKYKTRFVIGCSRSGIVWWGAWGVYIVSVTFYVNSFYINYKCKFNGCMRCSWLVLVLLGKCILVQKFSIQFVSMNVSLTCETNRQMDH